MSNNVRIVQLLCPQRHCIVASLYDPEENTSKTIMDFLDVQRTSLDPWCGICKSRNLQYEDRPTVFKTMEEAMPFVQAEQLKNLATMRHFQDAADKPN